jgi:NADH-quinone oxidoreductase subunit K
MNTPQGYLLLSTTLFVIGLTVTIVRRHPIIRLLGFELALQAVNLAVGALTGSYQDWESHVLLFILIAVSAVEFIVGLVVLLALGRRHIS